jgi:hypothetical protein
VPPDKETAYRDGHGGAGGGSASDRRKIADMKEELQSPDEPTRRFYGRVFSNLVKPSPLSTMPANASPFLKSNHGGELVRSPRTIGTMAAASICQENEESCNETLRPKGRH